MTQLAIDFTNRIEMTEDQRKIASIIERHRGKENAVSVKQLSELTDIDGKIIRQLVRHLIMHHDYVIGSTTNSKKGGYFIPVTKDEVLFATRSLRFRGASIFERAAKILKSSEVEVFGQTILELKERRKKNS